MNNSLIGQLLLQLVLIGLNAIFACAEIAVISVNDNKLAQLAAGGDKRAVRLARLTSKPARFLATIQVAITLSGFLGSAFAADNFSDRLVRGLLALGVPVAEKTLDAVSVILITLLLSYITLVFGELVPKRVAMQKAESLALGLSGLIAFASRAFAPLVWLLTASTNGILRLLGIDPEAHDEAVSEEEIRMLVDVGRQKGVIDREETEMIQNVFAFDDLTLREFATHRTELDILWLEDSPEEWERSIHASRHSRYVVCGESVDDVAGILDVKSYFRLADKRRETVLREAVRPPYFVPQSLTADVLFRQMKKSREYFAVVLDEYGGLLGIVTMSDLIEQIVGDLDEEGLGPELERLDAGTWRIRGSAPLDEVALRLNIQLPTEEYDTFGGFIFGSYGAVPPDGSQLELDAFGLHVKVTEIREHKIENALVRITEEAPAREGDSHAAP